MEEHAAFVASSASNNAAIDLLKMAVNRLNKFYNPSMYNAPKEEPELVQATDSQDGIFFAQVTKSESVAALEDLKAQQSEKGTLLKSVGERLGDLHKFCDMLIETFEERKKARESEIESDASAQMVLKSTSGKAER